MSRKKDILENLREYSSDQIVEAINDGVVTLYELSRSGNLTPLMRKRIEGKLAADPSVETNEEAKRPQETISSEEVENPATKVETTSNQEKAENGKIAVPEVVIPEAIITPMDQMVESATNTTETVEQEQPDYDEKPSNNGMFKCPFSFHGRIRRLEYWLSILLYYLYTGVGIQVFKNTTGGSVLVCAWFVIGCWFLWAQGAKRCHDRNNSGWYQIIPFYGFWMLFADGDEGENDYGDNPKGK